jgi:hypothetical protein
MGAIAEYKTLAFAALVLAARESMAPGREGYNSAIIQSS